MLSRNLLLSAGLLRAQRIQGAQDLRGHPDPTPPFRSGGQRGEDEGQGGPLPGEARNHLRVPAALFEGPLQEIRGADAPPVFRREERVGEILVQVFLQTLHKRYRTPFGS